MPSLSHAQLGALAALSDLRPPGTLTGGAALAGVHLGHRTTRDLDLFFHDLASLGHVPEEAVHLLRNQGFDVVVQERGATFARLLARRDHEDVVVDLVADPVPTVEAPLLVRLGAVTVLLDTPREILANTLCALLGRSELRDLIDVEALLARGHELALALVDASKKDAGFTALQLGWVLGSFPLDKVARAEGLASERIEELATFRDELVRRVLAATRPADV